MEHHPDRGGDPLQFKKIQEAYDAIKDLPPQSEQEYERTINFNSGAAFNEFFHNRRANRYINVDARIAISKAVNGGKYVLQIQVAPGMKAHQISIDVPPGVVDGEEVHYPKLLIGSIDVIVTFHLIPSPPWSMDGLNVVRDETFSIWDLIKGTSRDVETIKGTKVRVVIPPMTQPGTKLRIKGYGARNRQNYMQQGDMLVRIQASIPEDIPEEILVEIDKIKS